MARKSILKASSDEKKIKQYKGLGFLSSRLKMQKYTFLDGHAVLRRISKGGDQAIFVYPLERENITNFQYGNYNKIYE